MAIEAGPHIGSKTNHQLQQSRYPNSFSVMNINPNMVKNGNDDVADVLLI
jgi:hypothetical protein